MKSAKNIKVLFLILIFGWAVLSTAQSSGSVWAFSSPMPQEYSNISDSIIKIGPSNRGRSNAEKKNEQLKKDEMAKRDNLAKDIRNRSWERENFEKFIKELRESKSADHANFKYLKDGLLAHEGGPNGGHTIERHVGLSEKGLRDRYANDKSLVKRDGTRTTEYVSTFHSLKQAERFIEQTLQHNNEKISDWAGSTSNKSLRLDHIFTEVTGSSLNGPTGNISNVNGVRVVIIRDTNHVNGWKLLTAYPQKGQTSQ